MALGWRTKPSIYRSETTFGKKQKHPFTNISMLNSPWQSKWTLPSLVLGELSFLQNNHSIATASKTQHKIIMQWSRWNWWQSVLVVISWIYNWEQSYNRSRSQTVSQLTIRMQQIYMRLQNYNLTVKYVKGSVLYFADAISRAHPTITMPGNHCLRGQERRLACIATETDKDDIRQKVIKYTQQGLPKTQNNKISTQEYISHNKTISLYMLRYY